MEVELRLPFENEGDSPMRFIGRLGGPGAAYASLVGGPYGVAGHGRGAAVARFGAPVPSAGRYELTLEVLDEDGYVVEPPGKRKVTLVVEGVAAPVELPPVESPPAPEPVRAIEPEPLVDAASVEVPKPKPKAAPRKKAEPTVPTVVSEPQPAAEVPVVAEPPIAVPPEPDVVEAIIEPPKPVEEASKVVDEPPQPVVEVSKPVEEPPKPMIEAPKPRVVVEMPRPEPTPAVEPPKAEPTVVTFKREVKPEPVPEPVVEEPPKPVVKAKVEKPRTVVEMGEAPKPPDRTSAPIRREPAYDAKKYGKVLRTPKTGDVLELAPGGKALVLLDFENKGADESTYVLMVKDDLRPTEDFAYARTLLEQVNIRAGGADELAFEISAPENAPPQTLRLRITYGRRDGGRELEVSRLTLKVSPRIAVALSAPKAKVVVGPLNRIVDIPLEVKNEGNVETAYRLTVKSASDVAAEAKPGQYPDIEGKDNWRYLFDKEAEDLRQDGKVPARLRLLRTGIWWLGWWETQRVKAVAVPVTDPRNAERDGNAVDLTGTHWRLLPFPWFVSVPLLAVLFSVFFAAFGVDDVRVTNAIRAKASDILFVLQDNADKLELKEDRPPVKLRANLSWNAPFLSLLKVVPSHPGATVTMKGNKAASSERTLTAYTEEDVFRVTSILGLGGASSKRVVYLPMRTTDKLTLALKVAKASGGGFTNEIDVPTTGLGTTPAPYTAMLNPTKATVDGKPMAVVEKIVQVAPKDKLYIYPTNESGGNKVYIWAFEMPKEYTPGAIIPDAANVVPESGRLRFSLVPKATKAATDDLWLLTSDSKLSIVHLVIKRTAGGGL